MAGLGRKLFVSLVGSTLAICIVPLTAVAASIDIRSGSFTDGAAYLIQKPSDWNGALVLYSHGYVVPGSPNPAPDVGDPLTGAWLLGHGYALAGSSYASTGWALEEAIPDQIATLDTFTGLFGAPTRTIAWGHSLGGMITAGLLQTHPDRFDAALPMCGVVGGAVGVWNQALDAEFAIQQLLASGTNLKVVNLGFPNFANLGLAESAVGAAQTTPAGHARIALAAALGDLPGWFSPASVEPAATDYGAQEYNQYLWITQVNAFFLFFLRGEMEARAGGNPSWNTGVDYSKQLAMSADIAEVQALYAQAGLSLDADLATLAAAPRISADSGAVGYLTDNIVYNGELGGKPVLTLHTTGDGLVVPENEQAYRSSAQRAKSAPHLREAFVHRAGHCEFTPAETIAAFQALVSRLDTGRWAGVTDPAALNAAATALGTTYNLAPASYIDYASPKFLRPFDLG